MPARDPRIPFRSARKVPAVFALVQQDDAQAPLIYRGDKVVFTDAPVERGDLALIIMRPELVPEGGAQCLVMRLGTAIPPHVTFPWKEKPETGARMLLIVQQGTPFREFALRCDKVLAVRKFSHVQPLPE